MPVILKLILLCLVLVAAVYDLRFRRIPNWLNLSGLVLGLGCNSLIVGLPGLKLSVLGFLCAVAVYLPLYLIRGMGAGDVKLMAAVGSITGPHDWLFIVVATALIGGVAAVIAIARKSRLRQTFGNVGLITSELFQFRVPAQTDPRLDFRHRDAIRLPHGVTIASGTIAFLFLNSAR